MHVVALRFIFSLCIDRVLFMCVLHHIGCKKKNSATHLKCVRKHETEYWDGGRRTTKVHWKPNRKPPEQIEWTCGVYCLLSFIDIIQFVVYERKYGELYIIVDILYCLLLLFARLFASRQRHACTDSCAIITIFGIRHSCYHSKLHCCYSFFNFSFVCNLPKYLAYHFSIDWKDVREKNIAFEKKVYASLNANPM